jgi:ribosome-associated translation inhibitor RaiA
MDQEVQITFRHMPGSAAVEQRIREEVEALQHLFNRIISCHVVVEMPDRHHQRGRGFQIRIHLHVPGSEIVVNHEPTLHAAVAGGGEESWEKHLETHPDHKDIYVSVRDAFAAARRQLQDYAQVLHGEVKRHEAEGREP